MQGRRPKGVLNERVAFVAQRLVISNTRIKLLSVVVTVKYLLFRWYV